MIIGVFDTCYEVSLKIPAICTNRSGRACQLENSALKSTDFHLEQVESTLFSDMAANCTY